MGLTRKIPTPACVMLHTCSTWLLLMAFWGIFSAIMTVSEQVNFSKGVIYYEITGNDLWSFHEAFMIGQDSAHERWLLQSHRRIWLLQCIQCCGQSGIFHVILICCTTGVQYIKITRGNFLALDSALSSPFLSSLWSSSHEVVHVIFIFCSPRVV